MIRVFILQDTTLSNKILKVAFRKKTIYSYAKRFLKHHANDTLVCRVWFLGNEVEEFTVNKEELY